jgi:hypothetical protein
MPEKRMTVRPPPVSPLFVAVNVVLVAEPIGALRTENQSAQLVPPPFDSGAVAVPYLV